MAGAPSNARTRDHLCLRPTPSVVGGADRGAPPRLDGDGFAELVERRSRRSASSYRVSCSTTVVTDGGSAATRPFTLEDCADDAVALIDVLGVRQAIFVGYSMGARSPS